MSLKGLDALKNEEPPAKGMADSLLGVLGSQTALLLGTESAAVTVWMLVVLSLRSVLASLGLLSLVPHGLVFALPLLMQLVDSVVPFLGDCLPLLSLRITETVLGRIPTSKLAVMIPAHFIGCVLGAVVFKTLVPIAPVEALAPLPIRVSPSGMMARVAIDSLVVCAYNVFAIFVPEVLHVNRLSRYYLSVPIVLVIVGTSVGAGLGQGCSMSPAAEGALLRLHDGLTLSDAFQLLESMCGPIVGAVAAGLFCARLFPDDPKSWKRHGAIR